MAPQKYPVAQNPLLLRFHRLMDAFAKSDDERDFYLDKVEGFILYADLDKGQKELDDLQLEIKDHGNRYFMLPKMTFYETKKFMEGFVNEKVYDIDTKEKLLDIITAKEARENFLEFIYDHLTELEKWQQYYVERMRIRIIEWLRQQQIQFVFEEDLDLPRITVEKVKAHLFDAKVGKDVTQARDALSTKAKTYYSSEALNPRPKRGRPPKQQAKVEVEPQLTGDMYTTVPQDCRMFLYLPDITSATSVTFSTKFDTEAQFLASLKGSSRAKVDTKLEALSQRLESLRQISSRLTGMDEIIGEREGRLMKAVAKEEEKGEEKRGIMDVVKGFLPRRKEKKEMPETKPEAKKVTPIQVKKKK
ncbi:MAG: UPF0158 family protein [Verrucomicrobia bacterium]|nr:UPF0158 family protein [Verrucomicrobiota bacterium]